MHVCVYVSQFYALVLFPFYLFQFGLVLFCFVLLCFWFCFGTHLCICLRMLVFLFWFLTAEWICFSVCVCFCFYYTFYFKFLPFCFAYSFRFSFLLFFLASLVGLTKCVSRTFCAYKYEYVRTNMYQQQYKCESVLIYIVWAYKSNGI